MRESERELNKGLARKNQLLGIVQDYQGIEKEKLVSVCYSNFGWFPRTTREQIKLLVEFGSLRLEEKTWLFTSDYRPKLNETTLDSVLAVAEEKITIDSKEKSEGV